MRFAVAFWLMMAVSLPASANAPTTSPSPLGLKWDLKHEMVPQIEGYRYWYGSVAWGFAVYVGTTDLVGIESEIHLYFAKKKIQKAVLILGPGGINRTNCFQKFKKVVQILDFKYGPHSETTITRDPDFEDLLYVSKCTPVANGLFSVEKRWHSEVYKVILNYFGDDGEYYLELEYINKNIVPRSIDGTGF